MADNSRALDTHISRLNIKAREMGLGPLLDNVWGKGYAVSTARSDQNLGLGL
jgi:DNA-binding response OmpR family regulator